MDKIKIALVDDHKIFLDGIASLLEDLRDLEIELATTSAKLLLKKLDQGLQIDVLITDISMDEIDGTELCQQIKKKHPSINILVLSMHNNISIINRVLNAGAIGFLMKNIDKSELVTAIKAVSKRKSYYSQVISNTLIKHANENDKTRWVYEERLTRRELDVIKLLASEYTTQEIAEKLCISPHTVESHRKNTLRKTRSRNIAGLIRYAIHHDILDD